MSEPNITGHPKAEALREELARALFSNSKLVAYAILDGAANPSLLDHLYDGKRPEFECLYRGELEPDMAECAPYIVKLEADTPFCDWLIRQCWGNHWGIFVLSRENINAVRQHFRKLNMVYDPESNNPLLFRYYDPRVLCLFLPSCDEEQTAAFYGPVQAFFAEAEEGGNLREFIRNEPTAEGWAGPETILFIRPKQMELFRQAASQRFENEMVAHCQDFAPILCRVIGKQQLRLAVRSGIERAGGYGFTYRGSIRLFLELMFLFGSAFDSDPQYSWATRILHGNAPQMDRAGNLYDQVLDYQEKVSGPDGLNNREALRNLVFFVGQPNDFSSQNFGTSMIMEMSNIFPQKANYIGKEALVALIRDSCDKAKALGFTTSKGYALMVALTFVFGHGCTDDPLYPWMSSTLKDETVREPNARATQLEQETLAWLNQILAIASEKVSP